MNFKDNLTDVIEHAQNSTPTEQESTPSGNREVVNSQGEIITLGEKKRDNLFLGNKG